MLNYIWAGMILLGVIYGVCTGQMSALTGGALDSAREAVSLCITMAGVMALWMGLMEIAQESGMIAKMTKGIRPFLKFMFPRLPEDHPAGEYITTNLIANVLGLGWACTPAGLKAMEQLAELDLAYAQTVHKAQGSEYRAVVLAAMPAAQSLMVRGVLYTALTRARELLVVVGDDAAIRSMAANDRQQRRYSGLKWRLSHESGLHGN